MLKTWWLTFLVFHVLYYHDFQLYLMLSLRLQKLHRVLELNQSQWLKRCVEFNFQKRTEAEKSGD